MLLRCRFTLCALLAVIALTPAGRAADADFNGRWDIQVYAEPAVTGHSYVPDIIGGLMIEKAEERTKILALSSGTLLVYQLPDTVALDSMKFVLKDGRLSLTDGDNFTINLAEHTRAGRM